MEERSRDLKLSRIAFLKKQIAILERKIQSVNHATSVWMVECTLKDRRKELAIVEGQLK